MEVWVKNILLTFELGLKKASILLMKVHSCRTHLGIFLKVIERLFWLNNNCPLWQCNLPRYLKFLRFNVHRVRPKVNFYAQTCQVPKRGSLFIRVVMQPQLRCDVRCRKCVEQQTTLKCHAPMDPAIFDCNIDKDIIFPLQSLQW